MRPSGVMEVNKVEAPSKFWAVVPWLHFWLTDPPSFNWCASFSSSSLKLRPSPQSSACTVHTPLLLEELFVLSWAIVLRGKAFVLFESQSCSLCSSFRLRFVPFEQESIFALGCNHPCHALTDLMPSEIEGTRMSSISCCRCCRTRIDNLGMSYGCSLRFAR